MTAVSTWVSALARIEQRARLLGSGFGIEVALGWPLIGDIFGDEFIVGGGHADRVAAQPDRVFRYAIRVRASGVVLSHNHLHDTGPSAADHAVTRRLVAAGHLLAVPLLGSLVIEPGATHDLVSGRSWPRSPLEHPTSAL